MVVINEKLDLAASKGIVEACYSMPIFTIVVTLKKKMLKTRIKVTFNIDHCSVEPIQCLS